ncbi:MAG TPA: hypothetical protein PLJ34_04460, partial [Hyphomicrobiales bacterium]|nr:hypothetical protein [Hyphomicrobiales bacterium]
MPRDIPKIEVSVNGKPAHAAFYERLKSARMRDAKGTESDEVELVFDDANNEIEEPEEGSVIEVAIGYEEDGMVKRGTYLVDKPASPSGGPGGEFLRVHGRAADMSGDLKEMASEHFEDTTLGDVMQTIGTRHGLAVKVSPSLASIPVPYLARFNQSTLGFGSDLAKRTFAVARRHAALAALSDPTSSSELSEVLIDATGPG